MIRARFLAVIFEFAIVAALMSATSVSAQSDSTGSAKVHVNPKQAYVFVDGQAIRDGSQTIALTPGNHIIGVYNYGYAPDTRTVDVVAGKKITLNVTLQRAGDKVSGPFGDIELKGNPRAAVLLNGTTPSYFVGHVDEFDNDWIWHQWLLVKPGNYQVTAKQKGKTIWSGPVNVKAGQRDVVYLNHNGKIKTRNFGRGLTLGPQPRFDAGIASAMVPVAPVTAQLAASQTQTGCGQPISLNWKTANAADTSISNLGNVPISGDRTVSPTRTTTYELVAKGPGGQATQTVTIAANAQPTATLTLSQPEVRYHKVGDKVVEDDSATLNWSTSNANNVTIQPLGNVATNGSESVNAVPNQTGIGPINQDTTYTLNAFNACGGTATRTASLRVVGSIDPAPAVTLASLFYPTSYPVQHHPRVGLVASQEKTLAKAGATFKDHEQYAQPNELMIVGHADVRGPEKYNLALSERRAELVKDFLVSEGIAASDIKVSADGKDHELAVQQVQKLQARDPEPPPKWMVKRQRATWLAYNRRVDIILEPTGQQSAEVYPNDAPAARILWERPEPSLKAVESASQMPTKDSDTARMQSSGN
jgi:peptidoglycan-associated lipoprotein